MSNIEKIIESASRSTKLAAHVEYIRDLVRPAVQIQFGPPLFDAHGSRLNGNPALPHDFAWPTSEVGWYRFMGQINFGEVPATDQLPGEGLLSLFFNEDEEGEAFWGDEGFILGFYHADLSELVPTPPPEDVVRRSTKFWESQPNVSALAFKETVDLPAIREALVDYPFDEAADDAYFGDLLNGVEAGCDHLLGYPRGYTLAYDPTPGPDWQTLLSLASHDRLNLGWHDGDHLSVFIEAEKLRAGDFSCLRSDAG